MLEIKRGLTLFRFNLIAHPCYPLITLMGFRPADISSSLYLLLALVVH